MDKTTWRKMLMEELEKHGDTLIACTLDDAGLDREFDAGFGNAEGAPFTAWSQNRVYFPANYDGAEWVASVPRNPCDEATSHVGSE